MDLSKADKKVAREVIEKGLQIEFTNALHEADAVLQKWKKHDLGNPEAYHLLFKTIKNFDKHIAARYDDMRGSRYFITVVDLLIDGIIADEDIKGFSPQVIEALNETRQNL